MSESNDYFINKTLQRYLFPTILAILGTTAMPFINTMVAGQALGKQALAAMNLLSSFTFLFSMFGCLISIGASAWASFAMGKGKEREVGECETFAFVASFVLPIITSVLILLFLRPFMSLLGCNEELFAYMKNYAQIMLIFGFLTTLMYFPFNFLRLDGRATVAMVNFIIMAVMDVLLLILFMKLGWGLTGVAWATVIATAISDLIGVCVLFFGKHRQIRPVKIHKGGWLDLTVRVFVTGAASGLNNLCNMLRTMIMNAMVLNHLGTDASGAFAVACSVITLASASVFGCGQTVSPLVGVFYGERDYVSIRMMVKRTIRYSFAIHGLLFIAVSIFATPICEFFGIHGESNLVDAAFGIRMAAFSLIPAAIINVCIYYYTAVQENRLALVLTFLRAFGLVVLFSVIMFALGWGQWYMVSFVLAEFAAFGCMALLCYLRRRKNPERKGLLLLDESSKEGERFISFSVPGDKEGAVTASEKMSIFCEENDVDPRFAMSLPLALEELLVVMSEHSLGEDEHKYADVRILIDRKGIVLRIRCGGKIFDPIHWYHEKKATMTKEELMLDDSLGIRLIDEKSKQILFKSTFGVNNLIVVL